MQTKICVTFVTAALLWLPAAAQAGERVNDAALGAISGAVVGGPIGLVAGGIVGFTAGPNIARSWGIGHHHRRRPPAAIARRDDTRNPQR